MTTAPVVVMATACSCDARARELAAALEAPVLTTSLDGSPESVDEGTLLLEVTPERLQLRVWRGAGAPGPVSLELAGGVVGRRRQEAGLFKTPLARAVGVTRASAPFVVDATAGLGTDSALLAWMGCKVHAIERNPVLAALWRDALARLGREASDVAARLSFEEGDAREVLARFRGAESGARPDVIYLDPMFPPRSKSALVKKEMQVLHALHGEPNDNDATSLLARALEVAERRVVVKRPRGKAPLAAGVTHAHEGSTTRLDVYVRGSARGRS